MGGIAAPSLQGVSNLPSVFSSWSTEGLNVFPSLPGFPGSDKRGAEVLGIALTGNVAAEPLVAQVCYGFM